MFKDISKSGLTSGSVAVHRRGRESAGDPFTRHLGFRVELEGETIRIQDQLSASASGTCLAGMPGFALFRCRFHFLECCGSPLTREGGFRREGPR